MPAGKMYVVKKNYNRRNKYNKKGMFSKKQVSAIRKIAQKSGELKFVEQTSTSSGLYTGGSQTIDFPTIAQGDDENQRIGDKIYIKDYQFRGTINSGTANGLIRIFAFQLDTTSDGQANPSALTNLSPNDFWPNSESVDGPRYKILYDKMYKVDPNNNPNQFFKFKISSNKLMNKQIEFSDDAGAASDIIKGRIVVRLTTTNATATQITTDINSRVRYYD